jgi:hypothetical protein
VNDTHKDVEELEAALLQAGRFLAPAGPRGAWHANVMRAVRQIGPLSAAEETDSILGRLLWHVAVPAAACALALCIAVQVSGIAEQDVENNTVEYDLASVF